MIVNIYIKHDKKSTYDRHILHLHGRSCHVSMADLKRLRFVYDLVLFGREFHNLAPHVVSDWSPYLVVFEWGMHNVLAFLRL